MFERFTERARQVVVMAQEEARAMKHNYIATEHILMGLIREEEGLAARVLASFDITENKTRTLIKQISGEGEEVMGGQIPFTPRAKKVLELALREALTLGHSFIGTEHLLLGLIRENEGVAARILLDFGADSEKIRNEVIRLLSGRKLHKKEKSSSDKDLSAEERWYVEVEFAGDRILVLGGWGEKPSDYYYENLVEYRNATTDGEDEPVVKINTNNILYLTLSRRSIPT